MSKKVERIEKDSLPKNGKVTKNDKPKAKRNRMSLSCAVCRKRKVKCDRNKPHCKSCVKSNNTKDCTYNEPTWANTNGKEVTYVRDISDDLTKDKSEASIVPKVKSPSFENIENGHDVTSFKSQSKENEFNHNFPLRSHNNRHDVFNISNSTNGLSPYNLPILPPLNSLPDSVMSVKGIALQPLQMQTQVQYQPKLQPLFDRIKTTAALNNDVNDNNNDRSYNMKSNSSLSFEKIFNDTMPEPNNYGFYKPFKNRSDSVAKSPPVSDTSNNSHLHGSSIHISSSQPQSSSIVSDPKESKISFEDEIIMRLGIKKEDSINFFDGFEPMMYKFSRISNFGPLSWISLILKDPFIRPIRDEVVKDKQKVIFKASNASESHHEDRFLEYAGLDDVKPLHIVVDSSTCKSVSSENKFTDSKSETRKSAKSNSNSFFDNTREKSSCSTELFTLKEILKVLPKKKVVWLSIKRFFTHVYPFLPFLDKFSFISDIEKLLNGNHFKDIESVEHFEKIVIEKKLDFAILGTLLLVLKFAQLSLVVNDESMNANIPKTKEEKYLLDNPLPDSVVNVAQLCLNQFKLLRKCALPIFQFALLMNEYKRMNGLDDGTNPDCQIFTAMLIQMGVSIGLNRDPSKLDSVVGQGRLGNIWRKIWFGLLSLDAKQYILYGLGKTSSTELYDTKLPSFDEESSNIDNHDLEKVVIEKIKLNHEFQQICLDLADFTCTFKKEPNIIMLLEKLFNLESILLKKFGTLKDLLRRNGDLFVDKIKKVWDFNIYTNVLGLIFTIYSNLFAHFQNLRNFEAIKFIKEKVHFHWLYVFSNFVYISRTGYQCFGYGFDMLCTQSLLPIFHKGLINYFNTYVTFILAVQKLNEVPGNEQKKNIMKKLFEQGFSSISWYLPSLKALSGRHFHAWKLLKAHTLIIHMFSNAQVTLKSLFHLYNYMDEMSETELTKFLEISKYSNYKVGVEETSYFKTLKLQLISNQFSDNSVVNNGSSVSDLNTENVSGTISEGPFDKMLSSIEAWSKPMEEDAFWRNVWMNNKNSNSAYPNGGQQINNGKVNVDKVLTMDTDISRFNFREESITSASPSKNQTTPKNYDSMMNIYEEKVKEPLPNNMNLFGDIFGNGVDLFAGPTAEQGNADDPTDLFVDYTIYDMFN